MLSHKTIFPLLILAFVLLVSGCVPGDGSSTEDQPSGFFSGIWHGWIAPLSLIWGLFDRAIRVYEVINTGWWYDFGYYMAIIAGFGGLSLVRKKRKEEGAGKGAS